MQKKVYMTVDGNRRETSSIILKASDNTQKTATLDADVTLDLEAKALGTVNFGQSYDVTPANGKDGMSKVTFNVPAAPSGDTPSYQTKDLGEVNAGQHYDVMADSGYDALSMVSFDVPSSGESSTPEPVVVATGLHADTSAVANGVVSVSLPVFDVQALDVFQLRMDYSSYSEALNGVFLVHTMLITNNVTGAGGTQIGLVGCTKSAGWNTGYMTNTTNCSYTTSTKTLEFKANGASANFKDTNATYTLYYLGNLSTGVRVDQVYTENENV